MGQELWRRRTSLTHLSHQNWHEDQQLAVQLQRTQVTLRILRSKDCSYRWKNYSKRSSISTTTSWWLKWNYRSRKNIFRNSLRSFKTTRMKLRITTFATSFRIKEYKSSNPNFNNCSIRSAKTASTLLKMHKKMNITVIFKGAPKQTKWALKWRSQRWHTTQTRNMWWASWEI